MRFSPFPGWQRLSPWLLTTAVLFGAGCVDMDIILSLRKDGSARIEAVWSVADSTIDQTQALLRLQRQLSALQATNNVPPVDMDSILLQVLIPEQDRLTRLAERYRDYGVRAEKIKVEPDRNALRKASFYVTIDDLAKFAASDIFARYGFQLEQRPSGDYQFTRLAVAPVATNSLPPLDAATKQQLLAPVLEGLHVLFKLNVPGRIKTSNASRVQTHRAEWDFRFSEDPDVLLTMQNCDMHMLFDGLDVKIPELKGGRVRAPTATTP